MMVTEIKLSQLLRRGLEALGPNGENWTKHSLVDDCDNRCALGALTLQVTGEKDSREAAVAQRALKRLFFELWTALPPGFTSVSRYNDAPETTFADIKALYERAIEVAERAE